MAIAHKNNTLLYGFYKYSSKIKNIIQSNIVITIIIYSLISLYIVLSLLPLLHSGYYSDDMVNSLLRGQISLEKISFLHYTFNFIKSMLKTQGRFVPISIFTLVTISYFFYNLILYKTLILVLIITNIFLFGYFIKIVFKEKYLAYILMLCIPLFFQFRLYHDPILSFAGHLQLFFCYLFVSLIFLHKYLEHNNKKDLVVSIIFYNISLYAYEISVPLTLLFFILIFDHYKNLKKSFKESLPFIYSLTIAVLITFLARSMTNREYSGITFSLNVIWIIKTLIMQIYSSMPLSYFISNPSNLFNQNILNLFKDINGTDIMIIVIFNVLYWYLIQKINIDKVNWITFLLFGFGLLVFTAIPISFSAKYQQELNWFGGWGIGYIPVYIQYYGALMVLASMIVLINKIIKTKNWIITKFTLAAGISLISIINLHSNIAVVDKANIDLYYGRETLEKALDNNILEKIPENSTILVKYGYKYNPYPSYVFNGLRGWTSSYNWDNRWLFYLHSKKILNIVHNISQLENIKRQKQSDKIDLVNKNIFLLGIKSYHKYFENQHKEGYVILGKINYIEINTTDINKSKMYIHFWRVWHEPYAKEPGIIDKLDSLKRIVINGTQIWTAQ